MAVHILPQKHLQDFRYLAHYLAHFFAYLLLRLYKYDNTNIKQFQILYVYNHLYDCFYSLFMFWFHILAFYIFFQLYNRQAYSACLLYVRNSSFHYSVSCLSAFFCISYSSRFVRAAIIRAANKQSIMTAIIRIKTILSVILSISQKLIMEFPKM